MTRRAFAAILEMRLRCDWRAATFACVAAAVVGVLQPRGLAAPLVFCTLLGIVVSLLQSPGRFAHLDTSEQSAPLYGRELARAKALVPCTIVTAAILACALAAEAAGSRDLPFVLAATWTAVIAATLTALSATLRTGVDRLLYLGLACAVSGADYAIATAGHSIAGAIAFSAAASFIALRQYGEALARYDPV